MEFSAWELIGFDGCWPAPASYEAVTRPAQVRIQGGRALYEAVNFNDGTRGDRVKLSRLDEYIGDDGHKLYQVDRYVDADTILEVIFD